MNGEPKPVEPDLEISEETSSPLDLDLDESQAEPGLLARGAAVIKSFCRHAPMGPGVYRMFGADGEVL